MASAHMDDKAAPIGSWEKDTENSQDSTTNGIQVKEEPEDPGYDHVTATPGPSEQNSNTDSRNSSPLPPVHFEASSPASTRTSSPLLQGSSAQPSPHIPLNDLFGGSTIRTQLQGAIAGKKMDTVQNIVESLLKKNETLLAMSDAGGLKPNSRRARAVHDGVIKRTEPAFPSGDQQTVFPVSPNLQAYMKASKKTMDVLKQRMIRPKSPTRRYDSLLKDKSHFTYTLMESNSSDHDVENVFNVQNHELVCAIGSKSMVTDKSNKVVASLDFGYYWCNFCPYSSNNKTLLSQHVLEHRFRCKYCAYESFCRSDVVRHMHKMHTEFGDTVGRMTYCTFLSDYLRVKSRTDGKENKDPDEDIDELDPQEMEAALHESTGRKRKAHKSDTSSPAMKSPKVDSEESGTSDATAKRKDRSGKSRKSQNPKRHPQPKESDYDLFEMEVEEIDESVQADNSESKIMYSSNRLPPIQTAGGQDGHPFPTGMMQVIPMVQSSTIQTLTTGQVTGSQGAARPTRPSYSYRGRYNKSNRNSSSSSLYWSCGYCTFQSSSQVEIKEHSNREHPGKPHRYVALIKNMSPDTIINKSNRGNTPRNTLPSQRGGGDPTSHLSHLTASPHTSTDTKTNGEDEMEDGDEIVALREKADSTSLLKVKINTSKPVKKENTVYRCYHCSYTAKRHSAMKSHIYYKHRGKGLVAVEDESEVGQQIFFCARDDCTFKSENPVLYLNHVDQCTPWSKPELADVEVEPHIRECLEQTVSFAEMSKEKV